MLIGIVGKPSAGKSQFLNAACMTSVKTADYPFTTIEPNLGTAYVRRKCLCKELNVKDNPRNSICINGVRLIPVSLLDVAGLVPDAWKGRGLGNKFLDDLRRADALIHVVDASGSLDDEGRAVEAGSWDPMKDIEFLEKEIAMWMLQIIKRDWPKLSRTALMSKKSFLDILSERLAGLSITKTHILAACGKISLNIDKADKWSEEDIYRFVNELRRLSKPMILALNKIDKPTAKQNIERIRKIFPDSIPTCALAEYYLRQLAEKNIIRYIPGDRDFSVLKPEALSENDKKILERIKTDILEVYGNTGVQQILDKIVFEVLDLITVYPVEDVKNYCDHNNLVLPDVYLVPKGTTARQLAYMIHTDLGDGFIYAVDGRTKQRVAENYELKDGDLIKIVSAKSLK
ncbi:MAG: redox-regulated ATPase YchF [Candidatus Odinarchaeota archaeon]